MKKTLKTVALFLAVALLAVSLCSCQALDDARANRAIFLDDQHTQVEFRGNKYLMLNDTMVGQSELQFIDMSGGNWRVTEKDVPILLADWYGYYLNTNSDQTILEISGITIDELNKAVSLEAQNKSMSVDDYTFSEGSVYYVREDKYDYVQSVVSEHQLDHFYFSYWPTLDYDYDAAGVGEEEVKVLFDDELTSIVAKALKAPNSDRISSSELSGSYDTIPFYVCDSDMLITNWNLMYYLVRDGNQYYIQNNSDGNYYVKVSEADLPKVKEMFDKHPDAIEWGSSYSYEYYNAEDATVSADDNNAVTGEGNSNTVVI